MSWCLGLLAFFVGTIVAALVVWHWIVSGAINDDPRWHEHQSDDDYSIKKWHKTTRDE